MNKYIVCATEEGPTEALIEYSKMDGWQLVIVANKRTPIPLYDEYEDFANVLFMTDEYQDAAYNELTSMLDHSNDDIRDRRNIGIREAYDRGADVVALVDPNNIPMPDWGTCLVGKPAAAKYYHCRIAAVFDPHSIFRETDHVPRHRGYPIHLEGERFNHTLEFEQKKKVFDVQANLCSGAVDTDAICRMGLVKGFKVPFCSYFTSYQISPFSMRNTIISRRAMRYCPSIPFSGGMGDIWGSYYMQVKTGYKVVYGPPNVVYDERHSWEELTNIMYEEMPGYTHTNLVEHMLVDDEDDVMRGIAGTKAMDFIQAYQESFK